MGYSVVETKKKGSNRCEFSAVPDGWLDEMKQSVYVPPNKYLSTCKDPNSVPDSSWLHRMLVKTFYKNLASQSIAEKLVDEVVDRSESEAEKVDQKRRRYNLSRPKELPRQNQYTLADAAPVDDVSMINKVR